MELGRELACKKKSWATSTWPACCTTSAKIGIHDNVLRKPGPLTPEEFEHISST